MRIETVAVVLAVSAMMAPSPKVGGQNQGLAPGIIAYIHEDTGLTDPTRWITNIRLMDAQNPARQVTLTQFDQPGTLLGKPIWSKDYTRLAFSGNFNALFSLESHSIFNLGLDGTNLRQMTGFGVLGPLPGPTGTIMGRVVAQANDGAQGTFPTCVVTAQGSPDSATCRNDGTFVLTNVPVGAAWVRAQASVTYPPPRGSALSVGFAAITVQAGQVTNAGTITMKPQISKSIEPSWSRDGAQLVVTNEISTTSLVQEPDPTGPPGSTRTAWKPQITGTLSIWRSDGSFVRTLTVPNRPDFRLVGADWSPVQDLIACAANGSFAGESFVALATPDGATIRAIYQVPTSIFGPLHLVLQTRWSPDGRRLAFVQMAVSSDLSVAWADLFVINADGTGLRQLTSAAPTQFVVNPTWSPDGQMLAFDVVHSRDLLLTLERGDLYAINANATGLVRLTTDGRSFHPAWGRGTLR